MNAEQIQKEIRSIDKKIEFEKGKITRINHIIDEIRGNIGRLDLEKWQLKQKLKFAQKAEKLPSHFSIDLGGFWQKILESGIDHREIFMLQNMDIKAAELGRLLGISTGRAYQIREHAIRKMRHPHRIEIMSDFHEDIEYANHIKDFNRLIEEEDALDKMFLIA
jgi:hypothetical protein